MSDLEANFGEWDGNETLTVLVPVAKEFLDDSIEDPRAHAAVADMIAGMAARAAHEATLRRLAQRPSNCTCGGLHTSVDGNSGHSVTCPARP